jgi:hypothetical protein
VTGDKIKGADELEKRRWSLEVILGLDGATTESAARSGRIRTERRLVIDSVGFTALMKPFANFNRQDDSIKSAIHPEISSLMLQPRWIAGSVSFAQRMPAEIFHKAYRTKCNADDGDRQK